jgi:cytochrome bd-type quinol oxidase subunit 2
MSIINKIVLTFASLISIFVFTPSFALAESATDAIKCGANGAASGDCGTNPSGSLSNTVTSIVNLLSLVVGIVAVIMIMVAGLRYVTSAGNAESAKSARNTIIYAVIGLVVVALAQVIVHFVLDKTIHGTPVSSQTSSPAGGGSSSSSSLPGGTPGNAQ